MKEVSELAKGFDNRIVLSADNLYEKFGKENGKEILKPYFHEISWQEYKDKLEIQDAEPLIAYILSCHGNQNQYILSRYQEFRDYVKQKAGKGYDVTKEAGIFVTIYKYVIHSLYPIVWLANNSTIKFSTSASLPVIVLLSLAWKMIFSIFFTLVGEPDKPHCFVSPFTSATLHSVIFR